jgi:hypothetical protein
MPTRKKKRGRPATGRDPLVSIRIPQKLLEEIDLWASYFEPSSRGKRSVAIRQLIAAGLRALPVRDPKAMKKYRPSRKKPALKPPVKHLVKNPRKIILGPSAVTTPGTLRD